MESDKVMDRLLCGDVGFGKTEVAFRAAFKAVADGKQVALVCHGSAATFLMPASEWIRRLIGMSKRAVTPIPITPAVKPIISVSALNTKRN